MAGLLAALLAALVFATPFNHDEDQYLAAADLTAAGARLYRDFLYVQTPLYPELAGLVSRLAPGWTFLALRLFSAACGLATGLGVWTALRRLGVAGRPAAVAVLLMASVYSFQYVSSVVRNDALPMALLAWSIAAAAEAMRQETPRPWLAWTACGLLLGGAASAKISFAPLLAAAGGFLLLQQEHAGFGRMRSRRGRPHPEPFGGRGEGQAGRHLALRQIQNGANASDPDLTRGRLAHRRAGAPLADLTGLAVGAGLGLSPIVQAWVQAPETVRFALLGFWAGGPRRWYVANGLAWRMAPGVKLLYGLGDLALGPALAALVLVAVDRWRACAGDEGRKAALMLDLMILAGLVAAFAPSPTYKPYFAPLLPPLFVRLASTPGAQRIAPWRRALLALGAATGGALFMLTLAHAALRGWAPLQVAHEAHWVRVVLQREGVHGAVASLSPHVVLDSGFQLDPRFAGAAMIYRSADGLDPGLRRRLHFTAPSSLVADLDASPPAAIVTGYEGAGGDARIDLDATLRAYARARGYGVRMSPGGSATLYVRPVAGRHVAR